MSRIHQDQFIDEDDEEEVCPLCVEEFDLGDRYFKPCPCGYQICQFCYNNIKTTMNGLCPACRRPYDDKPFSFKNITQEELLQHEKNKAAQQKKRAAAKQKEAQKREADNLSRKHLAGLRVRQRNLVYVTGMRPKIQGDRVSELLRGKEYFGQYGDIIKIVVSKSKDAAHQANPPVGIYVTFARKEDAAACIEAINANAQSGDGKIRAQHGTTKYCSAYLRGEQCNNRNCMFLHEPGESAESFTRQDLSNMNAISTQQPSHSPQTPQPQPPPQHAQPVAAATQDISPSSPTGSTDLPALPVGANWANQVRRGSRTTASSVASPVVANTALAQGADVKNAPEATGSKSTKTPSSVSGSSRPPSAPKLKPEIPESDRFFHSLIERAFKTGYSYNIDRSAISDEVLRYCDNMPLLWDPNGGAKRRKMKEREAEEMRKRAEEVAALQDAAKPQPLEQLETERGGSLQLGGEPEERPDRAFGQQSAIQPPAGFGLNQQFSLDNDLSGLSVRGNTPLQQHQSQLLMRQLQSTTTSQHPQIGAHGRQPSRFSFNENGGLKTGASVQQTKAFGAFNGPSQQGSYYSGIQGPPPGLKTTGTPPVNGGSMFGQGHGFTSSYGAAAAGRDADRAWEVRGQRGVQDASKRELLFPFSQNTSTASTPAPGQMGYPYGSQPGANAFQESAGQQKQKKKGKKHRHANTSSSGGGAVDAVADPSILQARPYQTGTPSLNGAQGIYGAGQGQEDLPSLGQTMQESRRSTPTLPPGLFAQAEATDQKEEPKFENNEAASAIKDVTSSPLKVKAAAAAGTAPESSAKALQTTPKSIVPLQQDPTPAEMAASRKEAKLVQQKGTKASPATPMKTIPATSEPKVKVSTKAPAETKTESPASKRPHPGKLNIETTPIAAKVKENETPVASSASKTDQQNRSSRAPSVSAVSLGSRPGTPLASAVATGSPLKRTTQPRTLRITDTPKSEAPPVLPAPPLPVTTATPPLPTVPTVASLPSKIISRRTSVASLNQPGTPLTERADTTSIASTSVSRANSPPPLAARKTKSKKAAQKKKEKQAEVAAIVAPKETVEEIAPVVARKTKSKKNKSANSGPTPVVKPTPPPAIAEEKMEDAVGNAKNAQTPDGVATPVKTDVSQASSPAPRRVGTDSTVSIQDEPKSPERRDDRPITAASILQALESTHQLALSTLNLLKPLASQSELKKLGVDPFTSADLQNHIEQLRFELTKADEQHLKQGQAVRKDVGEKGAGKGRISGRCFVTPAGTRLSCLTKEEEERYAELEKIVMKDTSYARWGGAKASHITKSALKPKKAKLQATLAQEDVLRALSIATESLEDAVRDITRGTNIKVENVKFEAHLGPPSVHLAGQTVAAPTTSSGHPPDPAMDAREYVNKFVPRLLDASPRSVAVPAAEEDADQWANPADQVWNRRSPYGGTTASTTTTHDRQAYGVTSQLLADASAAAGYVPRPELGLPPPSSAAQLHVPGLAAAAAAASAHLAGSGSSTGGMGLSPADTAAAMDTLKEALSSVNEITKQEVLRNWDKVVGGAGLATSSSSSNTGRKGSRQASGAAPGGMEMVMSLADLQREGVKEQIAEAKKEALEWEKRVNKVVRGHRKALGVGN